MTTTVDALDLPFREATDFLAQKTRVGTEYYTDVWRTGHSRSFMVAGAMADALVADFHTEVLKAAETGTTLADFRKSFDDIVARHGWSHNGSPGWRSRIIYETNLSTAYSAGRYAQQTEPETLAVFPYWQYVHSGSAHPRQQHLAWNGLVLRADDPFWTTHYPPNGWHCGCWVKPVSARGLGRLGKAGPDQTPVIDTRRWVNPRTGEVHYVPVGIDPGFDYNPGLAWKGGGPEIPVDARWSNPPEAPPAPAVPPVRIADGGAAYRGWAQQLIDSRKPDGTMQVVGQIPEEAMTWLRERGEEPSSAALGITASQLLHLARDAKQTAGKGLILADVLRLPELLTKPQAILRERATGNLLYVTPAEDAAGRKGRLVVQLDMEVRVRQEEKRQTILLNAVKSASLVDGIGLRDGKRYELIRGKV